MDLGLGLVAGSLDLRLPQRAVDGDLEQRDEFALHVLDQIIGGARFQRRDRDRRILRCRDEHHRRRIGYVEDPLQRLETVETGHVLVERDRVYAALRKTVESPRRRPHVRP